MHELFINDYLVEVSVGAPCNTKNIRGLEEDGSVSLKLDDEVILLTQLEDDNEGISWTVTCTKVSQTSLYNAPDFVH